MPFQYPDVVPYLLDVDKKTTEMLGRISEDRTSPVHESVYGRNAGPRDRCDPEGRETWNPTAYDALEANYRSAKRWGDRRALEQVARNCDLLVRVVEPWIKRWGKPPGEDSRIPPCGNMEEGSGDTDPQRHICFYGACLAIADDDVRALMKSTTAEISRLLEVVFSWYVGGAHHFLAREREYLRYGYQGSSLVGVAIAAEALGMPALAHRADNASLWWFDWIFKLDWVTVHVGTDANPWAIWNYGDLRRVGTFGGADTFAEPFAGVVETREQFRHRWGDPFNYGWRRFGSQVWYDCHLLGFALRLWRRHVGRVGREHPWIQNIETVVKVQTQWLDPLERVHAPLGDLSGPGAQDFVNAKLHGWTRDGVLRPGETPMTLEQWEALADDAQYVRLCRTSDYHESDGGYYEREFRDPVGGVHVRVHQGRVGIPWNSPESDYHPDFESRGNQPGVADAIFMRSALLGSLELAKLATVCAFDFTHAANSSDALVTKGKRLDYLRPDANDLGLARSWCWARQAGQFILETAGKPANAFTAA